MLENKKVNGVHYSRIIASCSNSGLDTCFIETFLKTLRINDFGEPDPNGRKLTKEEICEIEEMATCGKLEFEAEATKFRRKVYELIKEDERNGTNEIAKYEDMVDKEWEGAE